MRAGRRALDAYDHERAADSFGRALALHGRGGGTERGRCDLLIGLGRARRFSGDGDYREILLEAARLADELDDPSRLAEAALANHRGFVSLVGGLDRERLAMLERAAERLSEPGPERCLVLAQLALERTFSADLESRRALAGEALALARQIDDQRILARVLIRHLIAGWGPDNTRERIAAADESIAISSGLGEQLDLFHGLHWRAAAQLENADVPAAERALREEVAIAARVGDHDGRVALRVRQLGLLLSLRGDLREAEGAADRALALVSPNSSSQPDGSLLLRLGSISAIRWQQGRLPELAPLLARGARAESRPAVLRLAGGARQRARRQLASAPRPSYRAQQPLTASRACRRTRSGSAAVATYAHAAAELGDRSSAAILHPLLEPYRNRLVSTSA